MHGPSIPAFLADFNSVRNSFFTVSETGSTNAKLHSKGYRGGKEEATQADNDCRMKATRDQEVLFRVINQVILN